ncbi:hypothetical protein ACT17Q_14975 [Cellulomonas sp. CW35]|uniref:Secreted protein n=1 Tax=Cellulomonas uda TaxID=1714 RepID=A0A4Y3KI44_CELUD|nr:MULTISPECIES: hypothetical protein [Cellulomonas]ASR56217.1 hypothetical protein CBP52_15180 [Cellulomonas sp. PSBB021]NII66128.1 hypothetical protein [Cellulomonas uda]GEA82630.1 hypothetical protein CUD01_30740 [Cellulomonas uda]
MKTSTRSLTVAAVIVLGFAFGGAANAATQTWGPRTKTWDGAVRVEASGSFWNNAGTANSKVTTKDRKADGNDVHGATNFYIKKIDKTNGTTFWTFFAVKSGDDVSNTTITDRFIKTYPAWASDYDTDQMRIGAFSCAQMGWPVPDQCTSEAILTTSY